jgi:hypothetical protein
MDGLNFGRIKGSFLCFKREMDELCADGWSKSFLAAECTSCRLSTLLPPTNPAATCRNCRPSRPSREGKALTHLLPKPCCTRLPRLLGSHRHCRFRRCSPRQCHNSSHCCCRLCCRLQLPLRKMLLPLLLMLPPAAAATPAYADAACRCK